MLLRQCAEDAATKMADEMADREQKKEDVSVSQMQKSVAKIDDKPIANTTAFEEKM